MKYYLLIFDEEGIPKLRLHSQIPLFYIIKYTKWFNLIAILNRTANIGFL